jgi:hypothetical protein
VVEPLLVMLFGVGLFADGGGGSAIAVVVFYRVGGGGQNTIKDT